MNRGNMNTNEKTYVFVGNREYVLREMMDQGLFIKKVWVMEHSFLHTRLLKDPFIDYVVIKSKKELINEIVETEFDILISNGCKYILPITQLKNAKQNTEIKFINIHPSFLPDLKGMDPINGACLLGRSGGAACHFMDDGIDTGSIIARVEIPMSNDIDAGLLFQLSFKAEVTVFNQAYHSDFVLQNTDYQKEDTIYYTISDDDLILDCSKGVDFLLRQARAFGYKSKGISLMIDNRDYKYYNAEEIYNQYVVDYFENIPERQIGIAFERSIIFKLDGRIVRLDQMSIDNTALFEGKYVN